MSRESPNGSRGLGGPAHQTKGWRWLAVLGVCAWGHVLASGPAVRVDAGGPSGLRVLLALAEGSGAAEAAEDVPLPPTPAAPKKKDGQPIVVLNEAEFRDRVYACWMGKNIGGTLGMPMEGKRTAQNLTFYAQFKRGEKAARPAANDDLDLQLLWLKAMEENDGRVDARVLGEYWLKYVPVNWNEYGVGKRNMRAGLLPPLSGEFNNATWKHSNGAWIRSEIWACLAPGCPALAARMAWEDACVDHGVAEGTLAEIFTASLESAAFIESDREKLIGIGLTMIPASSTLSRAIRAAVKAKADGKTWAEARQAVIEASEDADKFGALRKGAWFQAPRNVAFTMLGWLYGEGDFGKSLCAAVNCGDDTDCTGATLGSIFGIIHGTKGIPQEWIAPIGTSIQTVAVKGFQAPKDIGELTERTVAMTRKFLQSANAPVALAQTPADLRRAGELKLADPAAAAELWARSPYRIVWREPDVTVTLDYVSDPVIEAGQARVAKVTVQNSAEKPVKFQVEVKDAPAAWNVKVTPGEPREIAPAASAEFELAVLAPAVEASPVQMGVLVSGATKPVTVPFSLRAKGLKLDTARAPRPKVSVSRDDLALAAKGAVATADSELARDPGCAAKAIDGIVATEDNFANRWHSSLDTPHPHWIQVKLPKPARIGRVVVWFADPAGHPVSFQGLVLPEGGGELKEVFAVTDHRDRRSFSATFEPVVTDTFRFVVRASANPNFKNAAQVSEIELLPPK